LPGVSFLNFASNKVPARIVSNEMAKKDRNYLMLNFF
jgi:hypothetical protein